MREKTGKLTCGAKKNQQWKIRLRIKTLCGSVPSWDTRLPVDSVRCKYCRIAAGMDAYDFERWGR